MSPALVTALPGPSEDLASQAAEAVRELSGFEPEVAVVLGSGLGSSLESEVEVESSFPYAELPGFPAPRVPGHAGRLLLGTLAGVPVAVFAGRIHFYEGHGMDAPAMIPRVARLLGATDLVLTAAVGALVPDLAAGAIVLLSDHINFMGATPLVGWRDADGTPAFVPLKDVYDAELRTLAHKAADEVGVHALEGVYAAMAGPAYETPSEVAFLRGAGATVVGMSVVPEAVPARAMGMRVLGLCAVTNALGAPVSHEEVVAMSGRTAAAVGRLLAELLPRIERNERKEP